MHYFKLYDIPVSFSPDEAVIKKKYLELSKKFHPDFYTMAAAEKQEAMLSLSTENNKAYQTLTDFDKRMKYILKEKKILEEEEKYALPQTFLMEMLDLNELVLEGQHDTEKKTMAMALLAEAQQNLMETIDPLLQSYTEATGTPETFTAIKEFYYKRKYLLRIQEQLDKFASS